MVLNFNGKIALVTGGISGIGLALVKLLLQNGVKGVTIADVNSDSTQTVLAGIEKEFGANRAIFVKTDVSDFQQFDSAFKKTIEHFKHVDILINNAGILNDKTWEREIAINMNGVIHGILLGLENYLPKYKQGPEAVIVNMSSSAGVMAIPCIPIYSGIKTAIMSMTRCWGHPHHYDRTKVRLITICPGATNTALLNGMSGKNLGEPYEEWLQKNNVVKPEQEPEYLAQETMKLIQSCPNGSIWVIEGQPAYQYIFPDKETFLKHSKQH